MQSHSSTGFRNEMRHNNKDPFTYFHQLGVAQPGTHKHDAVVQVGQTLGNGGLSQQKEEGHGKTNKVTLVKVKKRVEGGNILSHICKDSVGFCCK